ncbi:MAG: hypothetical protein NC419_06515 [Muribaculaceae bacterium]|nr:hypothetical protein [Muribaculaceae bacterium]
MKKRSSTLLFDDFDYDGIEDLFENFDAGNLFSHIEGNPDDVIETPNESKDYVLTIDFKKRPKHIIAGSYDKKGLPEK